MAVTDRRRFHRPAYNDLDLRRWRELEDLFVDSLWLIPSRDRTGPHSRDYHGNFVPQVPHQVIRRYTRRREVVVDLFSGLGTTLIECRHLGRHGIGVELSSRVNREARSRVNRARNPHRVKTLLFTADSTLPGTRDQIRQALGQLGASHAHHVILHPPYWDIIPFSESNPADLSRAPSEKEFYRRFREAVRRAVELLCPGRFLTLVIGDKYCRGEWIPLGFRCMEVCLKQGLRLKAINVKDIQGNERGKGVNRNLWRYRALRGGFYLFKHEYVMIFRKP